MLPTTTYEFSKSSSSWSLAEILPMPSTLVSYRLSILISSSSPLSFE
ncbi:hypothetical protein PAP_00680 [Palaeococcus pacificus DY20341]|uniref:Uncharacterized protein n=1 Tax=Palaeococcus pacificus DY20341 TaxID=1343739 RepID=A0A075LP05_9EURY|nr:hypothetical protein PAP_00680 [Palaeococcus pacificus DY20341]